MGIPLDVRGVYPGDRLVAVIHLTSRVEEIRPFPIQNRHSRFGIKPATLLQLGECGKDTRAFCVLQFLAARRHVDQRGAGVDGHLFGGTGDVGWTGCQSQEKEDLNCVSH